MFSVIRAASSFVRNLLSSDASSVKCARAVNKKRQGWNMQTRPLDGFRSKSRESVTSALSSDSALGAADLTSLVAQSRVGGCYFHFGAYPDSSRLFIYIRLVCSVRSEIFPFADSHASGSFRSRRGAIETCASLVPASRALNRGLRNHRYRSKTRKSEIG
jgi:hypothetical protein